MDKYSIFITVTCISIIVYLFNLIKTKKKYGWDGVILTLGPDMLRLLVFGLFFFWALFVVLVFVSTLSLIIKIILLIVLSVVGIFIWILYQMV